MVGSVVAALDRAHAVDTHKQDFVYGQGIDEIVMLEQADVLDHDDDQDTSELTRSFYHRNALGSVVEVTDALEATVCSYRYDPYGAVTITVGGTPQSVDPLAQHWTFTGRFFDEETGFYYYRARMYDPARGRFLQRDPLGYAVAPGLHEYVWSSPQNLVDPFGLQPDPKPTHKGATRDAITEDRASGRSVARSYRHTDTSVAATRGSSRERTAARVQGYAEEGVAHAERRTALAGLDARQRELEAGGRLSESQRRELNRLANDASRRSREKSRMDARDRANARKALPGLERLARKLEGSEDAVERRMGESLGPFLDQLREIVEGEADPANLGLLLAIINTILATPVGPPKPVAHVHGPDTPLGGGQEVALGDAVAPCSACPPPPTCKPPAKWICAPIGGKQPGREPTITESQEEEKRDDGGGGGGGPPEAPGAVAPPYTVASDPTEPMVADPTTSVAAPRPEARPEDTITVAPPGVPPQTSTSHADPTPEQPCEEERRLCEAMDQHIKAVLRELGDAHRLEIGLQTTIQHYARGTHLASLWRSLRAAYEAISFASRSRPEVVDIQVLAGRAHGNRIYGNRREDCRVVQECVRLFPAYDAWLASLEDYPYELLILAQVIENAAKVTELTRRDGPFGGYVSGPAMAALRSRTEERLGPLLERLADLLRDRPPDWKRSVARGQKDIFRGLVEYWEDTEARSVLDGLWQIAPALVGIGQAIMAFNVARAAATINGARLVGGRAGLTAGGEGSGLGRVLGGAEGEGSRLIHLTTPEREALIRESGTLIGRPGRGLYAFEGTSPISVGSRRIGGLSASHSAEVAVPGSAARAFHEPPLTGVWNYLRRGAGVRVAPGSVDLATGRFTPYATGKWAWFTRTREIYIAVPDATLTTGVGAAAGYGLYEGGRSLYERIAGEP
jgi:RHS repeat-associated protein